jgi:hypothetical protein
MSKRSSLYKRHRFPPEIIQHVVPQGQAAKRFFKRLLRASGSEPRRVVTDKLRSYGVAHRELIPYVAHDTSQYANNRAELSNQPTRVRERGMRRFKSVHQAQRFLSAHAAVYNLFNLGRLLISAKHYQFFRARSLPLGYSAHLRLGYVRRLCEVTVSWSSVGNET